MKPCVKTILRAAGLMISFAVLVFGIPFATASLLIEKREPLTKADMAVMTAENRDAIIDYIRRGGYMSDEDIEGISYIRKDEFYGHGAVEFVFDTVEYCADRYDRSLVYVESGNEARWLDYWINNDHYIRQGFKKEVVGDSVSWYYSSDHDRIVSGEYISYTYVNEAKMEKLCDNFYYVEKNVYHKYE